MKNLPHSLECEKALLGCVLLKPEIFTLVTKDVGVGELYDSVNREIFSAMVKLSEKNIVIDLATLSSQLNNTGAFERIGGSDYLIGLIDMAGSTASYKHYVEIVKQKATLRETITLASDIHNKCFDEINSEVICTMLNGLNTAISRILDKKSVLTSKLDELIAEQIDRSIAIKNGELQETVVNTGFSSIDTQIGGFKQGNLVVLAGRPGSGKTALGLNMALSAIKDGHTTHFYSFEMTRQELVARALSQTAKVGLKNLSNGLLTEEDVARMREVGNRDFLKNLVISEHNAVPSEIAQDIDVWNQTNPDNPVRLLIIDHLQITGVYDNKRYDRRDLQLAAYTNELKNIAKTRNLTVLLLSQLNRNSDGRKEGERAPKLSDLRDSGATEQDSDVVLALHRKQLETLKLEDSNDAVLLILKNRNGTVGRVPLVWLGIYTCFAEKELIRVEEPQQVTRKPHYTEKAVSFDVFGGEM